MSLRPRIGLLFCTSGWFHDVGLQDDADPLTSQINEIAGEIFKRLSSYLEPVYDGVVYTEDKSTEAAERIRTADVDGIIIIPLMWCEDGIIRAALKKLNNLPMLVGTVFPYDSLPEYVTFDDMLKGSGSVGTLQISGMLRREGWNYHTVTGYYRDDQLYENIAQITKAFALQRVLKSTKCGVLPFRCDQMSTTYINEFSIRTRYGIELIYFELERFHKAAQAVSDSDISVFTDYHLGNIDITVDTRNLIEGIKYAIAMERVLKDEGVSILAINDIIEEMHNCFGLRPCLDNPRLNDTGTVVAMEADIAAGIAMFILKQYTGEIPFYTEIFTADIKNNYFLMGHAGYHNSVNRDTSYPVKIVSDIEYKNSDIFSGACTYFKFKPGPVTAVNCVYDGSKLSFTSFEGTSLSGPPKLEGNCHLLCQPDFDVSSLYQNTIPRGTSQHWIIIPGHHLDKLFNLTAILDIAFLELSN